MIYIDLIIIVVFLAITLIIGLYNSREGINFRSYAVGNRKISTIVLTLSLIATIYGGGNLSTRLDAAYRKGWYTLLMDLAAPVNIYLATRFIIVRMKEFMGHLSIAESMGSIYGKWVRMATALFNIMLSIGFCAIQIKIGHNIITTLFPEIGGQSVYVTPFVTLLMLIYAAFGGTRSVVLTDVYQFLLFSLCFPILAITLLYHVKHPIDVYQKLMSLPQFNPQNIFQWNDTLKDIMICLIWLPLFLLLDPARIQRFYMAASAQEAMKIFNKAAIVRIIVSILFLIVAITLHISDHVVPTTQNVLHYIIKLTYFPGIRGILVTVILALLMSTADSYLHVASVLFANDLWPILANLTKHNKKPTLKIARVTSVCIGLLSLIIAYQATNVKQLFNQLVNPYLPIITAPFVMTCLGFRPNNITLLSNIAINAIFILYHVFYKKEIRSDQQILIHFIFSAFLLVFIHYLLPKIPDTGWVGIKDRSLWDLKNQATKRWWMKRIQQLKYFFTRAYRVNLFPKNASTFILLGSYSIINTIIALFFIQKHYFFVYIYSYMAIISLGTLLMIYPALHCYRKGGSPMFHWIWPILLIVMLFLAPIQWAKLGNYSPMVCALLVCNFTISVTLTSLKSSVFMLFITLAIHRYIPPYITFDPDSLSNYQLIYLEPVYASLFIIAVIVGFTTYKRLGNKYSGQLQTIALTRIYEQQYALVSLHNQVNWNRLDPTYSGKVLQDMADELSPYVEHLPIQELQKKFYRFSQSLLKRAKEERTLTLDSKSIHRVDVEKLILNSYETVRKLDIPIQLLLTKKTKEKYLLTDPTTFERLFMINFLNLCQGKYTIDHTVYLTISDTLLSYPFPKPYQMAIHSTYEKQLKYPTLPALAFLISTDTDSLNILPTYVVTDEITSGYLPKTINNLYQEESRQIVQAHGGYIQIMETETCLTCLYILPIDGKKVMRFKRYHTDDLSNKVAETDESLAQEKELIGLLVSSTTLTKQKVKETIHFIKKAHGNVIRKSGDPYYTHPMGVAKIVLEATKNTETILAALLHDVVEDTTVTLEQIELLYGMEVAYIVDMVTHYNTYGLRWKLDHSDNQSILNKCKDIRVVQIKLADRLHNLRTITARKLADQKRIAKDTIEFYIPWSKKNNVLIWLSEMENICKQILHTNST